MTTKELVAALQAEDPEGNACVMCGGRPVWFPEAKPAWYDGVTHALVEEPADADYIHKKIVGYRIFRSGPNKVVLHTYDVEDFVDAHPDAELDLSGLGNTFHRDEWQRVIDAAKAGAR